MGRLAGCANQVRAVGFNPGDYTLKWTYGSGGAIASIDVNDFVSAGVTTPVVDSTFAGITDLVFPKCDRVDVVFVQHTPATGDLGTTTDYLRSFITELDPTAGTARVRFITSADGFADPSSGATCAVTFRVYVS